MKNLSIAQGKREALKPKRPLEEFFHELSLKNTDYLAFICYEKFRDLPFELARLKCLPLITYNHRYINLVEWGTTRHNFIDTGGERRFDSSKLIENSGRNWRYDSSKLIVDSGGERRVRLFKVNRR